jgi:uncharacterized protein YmfQ (DUF2313 family)
MRVLAFPTLGGAQLNCRTIFLAMRRRGRVLTPATLRDRQRRVMRKLFEAKPISSIFFHRRPGNTNGGNRHNWIRWPR